MRLQLQRYLLSCKVRCRRAAHFLKAELADRKAECCFLACAWRSTSQLPSQRIRAWRERMRGTVLRKSCTVSVPWSCQVDAIFSIVVSYPRSHHRRCGLDPTGRVTGSAVLPSLRVRPRTRTARARDASKDAEVPSKRGGSPLGLLSCGCLENGSQIHMGIMRSRYERSFLPISSRRFVCFAFAHRHLLCSKDWCSQTRFRAVLDGGFAGARQIRCGPFLTSYGLDNCKRRLLRRAPSSIARGHCRSTPCRGDAERCGRTDI